MSDNNRATDGPNHLEDLPPDSDAELIQRITRSLHSRAAAQPDPAVVAARIEAELALVPTNAPQTSRVTTFVRRGGKIVVAGVLTSVLAAAATGAAAAANPYSDVARTAEKVAQTIGIEWSAMPKGYTRGQYEAFWGAGYTADNVDTLSDLWKLDPIETKARAGQMLLDGRTPPVKPGAGATDQSPSFPPSTSAGGTQAEYDAFWGAGYTPENLARLDELWKTDSLETKARAGKMILDGKTPPVAPSGHR
jgi:hypothetical protein